MPSRIKEWWNAERVGRFEEGTSQDFCPTNGDAACFLAVICAVWTLALLPSLFRLVFDA